MEQHKLVVEKGVFDEAADTHVFDNYWFMYEKNGHRIPFFEKLG